MGNGWDIDKELENVDISALKPLANNAQPIQQQSPKQFNIDDEINNIDVSQFKPLSATPLNQQPDDVLEQAATGARSFVEGATMGLSEPLVSGAKAGASEVYDYITKGDDLKFDDLSKKYDEEIQKRLQLKAKYPTTDISMQITGAFAPLLATGGAALAGRFGLSATSSALKGGAAVAEAVNPVSRVIGAGTNAIGQGLTRAGQSIGQAIGLGGKTGAVVEGIGRVGRAATTGTVGALASGVVGKGLEEVGNQKTASLEEQAEFGGKLGAGIQAGLEALGVASKGASKVARILTGLKQKVFDRYIQNADDINKTRPMDEIQSDIQSHIQDLSNQVKNKEITLNQAQKSVDALLQSQSDDLRFQKQIVEAEWKKEIADMKNSYLPKEVVDDVMSARKDLYNQNNKLAAEAREILEKENVTVPKGNVLSKIDEELKGIQLSNGEFIGGTEKEQKLLNTVRDQLTNLGPEISGKDAKKIIKFLDDLSEYSMLYTSGESRIAKSLRKSFDESLKTNKNYSEKMKEVALRTALLEDMNRWENDQVSKVLSKAQGPTGSQGRETIEKLGQLTGRDFKGKLAQKGQEIEIAQDPNKVLEMRTSDPRFQDLQAKEAMIKRLRSSSEVSPDDINILNMMENKDLPVEIRNKLKAQWDLDQIKKQNKGELNLDDPKKIEALTNAIKRNIDNENVSADKDLIEKISKASGKDFLTELRNRSDLDQFDKSFSQGSKNVKLWQALTVATTSFIGSAIDPVLGGAIGAGMGAVVDAYGPKMAKSMVDAYLAISKNPTMQEFYKATAKLPPDVREAMKIGFLHSVVQIKRNEGDERFENLNQRLGQ